MSWAVRGQVKESTTIHKYGVLQNENEEYELKRQNALNEIMHMRIYLTSNKFWHDSTIQVKDVLNRIDNIQRELI